MVGVLITACATATAGTEAEATSDPAAVPVSILKFCAVYVEKSNK